MSDPNPAKSDSDVSSNSSWDVISESDDSSHDLLEDILDERNTDDQKLIPNNKSCIEETFITIPDVEEEAGNEDKNNLDEASQNTKARSGDGETKFSSSKTNTKKNKDIRYLRSLSIVASILAVTGISLLCLLFPNTSETKALEELHKDYMMLLNQQSPKFEDHFTKPSDEFDLVQREELLKNIQEIMTDGRDLSDEETCSVEDKNGNITEIEDHNLVHPLNSVKTPEPMKESVVDKTPQKTPHNSYRNSTMSIISGLRKNLMNPRLHLLLCTVMKDLYLLKLLKEVEGNQTSTKKSPNVIKKPKHKSKKAGESDIIKKTISKKPKQKVPAKKLKSVLTNKTNNSPITSNSPPNPLDRYSQDFSNIFIDTDPVRKNQMENVDDENGKSECERRFQELDHKWRSIGQSHRQKVQEIKEKFKSELHRIRENEKVFPVRKERMKVVREKYIQRLRNDRETYLYHFRRLRDERARIMKDICNKKKVSTHSKDASVGNYPILLPDTYDFQEKLESIRKRQYPKEQHEVSSFVTSSYPSINLKSESFVANQSSPNIWKDNPFSTDIVKNRHKEIMKKYYETKNHSFKSKILNSKDVGDEKLSSLLNSSSTVDTLTNTVLDSQNKEHSMSETEPLLSNEADLLPGNGQFKITPKKSLYNLFFDKNGEKIKKAEMDNHHQFRNQSPSRYQLLSKQDPKPTNRRIISFKGRL